jgi:hypothetical protein
MSSDEDTLQAEINKKAKLDEQLKNTGSAMAAPTPVADTPTPAQQVTTPENDEPEPPHRIADFFERSDAEKNRKSQNPMEDAMNELLDFVIEMQKSGAPVELVKDCKKRLDNLANNVKDFARSIIGKKSTPEEEPEPDIDPDLDTPAVNNYEPDKNPASPIVETINKLKDWATEMKNSNAPEKIANQFKGLLSDLGDRVNTFANKFSGKNELSAMNDTDGINNSLCDIEMQEMSSSSSSSRDNSNLAPSLDEDEMYKPK